MLNIVRLPLPVAPLQTPNFLQRIPQYPTPASAATGPHCQIKSQSSLPLLIFSPGPVESRLKLDYVFPANIVHLPIPVAPTCCYNEDLERAWVDIHSGGVGGEAVAADAGVGYCGILWGKEGVWGGATGMGR